MASFTEDSVESHLERLQSTLSGGSSLARIPQWMCDNTRLRGNKFSFKHHEYQLQILNDPSPHKVVRKCSQVGISEMSARLAMAQANIIPGFTVIYTLPTADFAKTFAKTRMDPIIQNSPKLQNALHPDNDNTQVKQFGESFVYIKGTRGQTAAISVPADHLIHDELDFSDLGVVSTYHSRLTHSPYKFKTEFSTPTVDKYGISGAFNLSRRFFNFCKCNHCNHQYIPNYFEDVRVPKYTGKIEEITAENIHLYNVRNAVVICPQCGKEPDLGPDHREWVCENPSGDQDTAGFQISPFDAPHIIKPGDLITASTTYKRFTDFVNFGLGLPAEDKETAINEADVEAMMIEAAGSAYMAYVMGIDVGQQCHLMVAGIGYLGEIDVVHSEVVPHYQLETRKRDLKMAYGVRITVMDSMPYFDTLIRMQGNDADMWGAMFVKSKDLDLYRIKRRDENMEVAEMFIRQLDINRNRAFDALMEAIRAKVVHIKRNECADKIKTHLTDMKRIRAPMEDGEISFQWRKSDKKEDHFHHTLLYTWLASKMTGLSGNRISVPTFAFAMPLKKRL